MGWKFKIKENGASEREKTKKKGGISLIKRMIDNPAIHLLLKNPKKNTFRN